MHVVRNPQHNQDKTVPPPQKYSFCYFVLHLFSPLTALVTTDLISVPVALPFPDSCISGKGNMYCFSLASIRWDNAINIHPYCCMNQLSNIFIAAYSIICVYHNVFILCLIRHLGCSQFLVIINQTSVHIREHLVV